MSKVLNRIVPVIISLIIVAVAFSMITDSTDAQEEMLNFELFSALPFFQPLMAFLAKFLEFSYNWEEYSFSMFIEDVIKLLIMSFLRPLFVGLLYRIFIKMPSGMTIIEQEDYMDGFLYKIKTIPINLIASPLLAFAVSGVVKNISKHFEAQYGQFVFQLIVALIIIALFALSVLPLALHLKFTTAILWRLFITLFGELLNTLIIVFCVGALIASIQCGNLETIIGIILGYIMWAFVFEIGFSLLRMAIAGNEKR